MTSVASGSRPGSSAWRRAITDLVTLSATTQHIQPCGTNSGRSGSLNSRHSNRRSLTADENARSTEPDQPHNDGTASNSPTPGAGKLTSQPHAKGSTSVRGRFKGSVRKVLAITKGFDPDQALTDYDSCHPDDREDFFRSLKSDKRRERVRDSLWDQIRDLEEANADPATVEEKRLRLCWMDEELHPSDPGFCR